MLGRLVSPLAVLFIKREPVLDTVKRLNRQKVLLDRDNLVWWLSWFNTDDNTTDEWWYGMYNTKSMFKFIREWTQESYDNSKIIRWYCRAMWLQRNSMYTFNRKFFGISPDNWLAWQYTGDKPLAFGYYNSINIGWKAHKGIYKLMYAGRVLGIRKIADD
jgi:hypothetical protein